MNNSMVRSFKALVLREFWENKGSMFYSPLILAAFFAGVMILGAITGGTVTINHQHTSILERLPSLINEFDSLGNQERSNGVQMGLFGPLVLFGFVMLIISFFYCLSSLYDERKDKSILFWKSLPISDTATVLSKFASVCLMIPVLYFAVVTAFQLYLLVFATVGAWFGGSSGISIWASSNYFSVMFNGLFAIVSASLWFAPIWAWLMFASSWAKKVTFLWGTLPIFLISIGEAWIFHSSRFIEMVGLRIGTGFAILNSNMNRLVGGDMFDGISVNWYDMYVNSEFWVGLIVSALFLAGAVYTRRHRDES